MSRFYRRLGLILSFVILLITSIDAVDILSKPITGDISPFPLPVMKVIVPISKHVCYKVTPELELKLYKLVNKERDRLRHLRNIALFLNNQIDDLVKRTLIQTN